MLQIDAEAPRFQLANQDGRTVDLEAIDEPFVLLYWYPKADTPGCTSQAISLRDQHEAFGELGCRVLGASFDTPEELAAFSEKFALPFDLLSDADRELGKAYEVAGADGSKQYAERTAYLIGPERTVRCVYEVDDPEFFADAVLADLEELTS